MKVDVLGEPPPPNDQDHVSGTPVDKSVKNTYPPACITVSLATKSATGGAVGSHPSEVNKLLLTPDKIAFISAAWSLLNIFWQLA